MTSGGWIMRRASESATPAEARELGQRLREALTAMLDESWPQPWTTGQLQQAFSGRHHARVYNALRALDRAGRVRQYSALDVSWWASTSPEAPPCSCGRPAQRVVRSYHVWRDPLRLDTRPHWVVHGGYTCTPRGEPPHNDLTLTLGPWPWPDPAAEPTP